MSPDLQFVRREGNDEVTALYNRIAALERIKFLTGVDLKEKPTEYKQLIDCELYVKYYKDCPGGTLIDEDFCQRAAEVIRILEKEKKEDLDKALEAVPDRVEQLYTQSKHNVPISLPPPIIKKRNAFISIIRKFLPKKASNGS